jgi:hypothetical protein
MASGGTRTSLQRDVNMSTPERTPPSSVSSVTSRPRRPGIWCRVQSLRNRIYRTTRTVDSNSTSHSATPRIASSISSIRRRTTNTTNRRTSGFIQPTSTLPLSLVDPPEHYFHNIDPNHELPDDRRPRSSHATLDSRHRSSSRHRSIWGVSATQSRPISANPTPPLPAVIDNSTQTNPTSHPIQPFNITRRPGEDQAEMLSRFLYVAGAALAASLVGSTDSTTAQLQDFSADFAEMEDGTDPPEGSFEGFLRALRQGRTQFAHALRNDSYDNVSGEQSGSAFTYLLMYRFTSRNATVTPTTTTETTTEEPISTPMTVETNPSSPTPSETSETTTETQMVPFVIIGVQPVPPRDSGHTGVPSFSEGVASLLANARQTASRIRPSVRPTTSSGDINSTDNVLRGTTSIPAIPGSWRDSPPPMDGPRRRASIDGSFRAPTNTITPPVRERESNTRAWQMYIYGGAYPENHLIFTAPTLFTDVFLFQIMLIVDSKFRGYASSRINFRRS